MYKTYCLYAQGYSSAPSMFNIGCLLAFKRQASGFQHKEIFLGSTILGQTQHQGTMAPAQMADSTHQTMAKVPKLAQVFSEPSEVPCYTNWQMINVVKNWKGNIRAPRYPISNEEIEFLSKTSNIKNCCNYKNSTYFPVWPLVMAFLNCLEILDA